MIRTPAPGGGLLCWGLASLPGEVAQVALRADAGSFTVGLALAAHREGAAFTRNNICHNLLTTGDVGLGAYKLWLAHRVCTNMAGPAHKAALASHQYHTIRNSLKAAWCGLI